MRTRAFQAIVEQVQQDIFAQRRRPGDRLPTEQQLGVQFGVSRAGVREALRVLERQGLVEVRHGYGGGAFVAEPGPAPLVAALEVSLRLGQSGGAELYQARLLLEPALTRLAVERDAAALARRLHENLARTSQVLAAGGAVSALNREFHALVAEGAGNRVLQLMMQALQEVLESFDQRYPNAPEVSRCAFEDHGEMLEAIRTANAAAAETLMRRHLLRLEGRLRGADRQSLVAATR